MTGGEAQHRDELGYGQTTGDGHVVGYGHIVTQVQDQDAQGGDSETEYLSVLSFSQNREVVAEYQGGATESHTPHDTQGDEL